MPLEFLLLKKIKEEEEKKFLLQFIRDINFIL